MGIVEMLVGGFTQDPRPATEVLPDMAAIVDALATASSLPAFVSLLVVGDVEDNGR
ncbi:hypothetical protein GCM10025794_34380 [Massilia kyonggiensis]